MTTEEYAALQAAISAAAAAYALQVASLFAEASLSISEWLKLLDIVYPQVEQFRVEAADLARRYYDGQRAEFHPELPQHDQLLEHYEFDWFMKNMEPVRRRFSQPNATEPIMAEFVFQVVREVETAGRRQIIHSVADDKPVIEKVAEVQERRSEQPWVSVDENRPVQGWARVATGRETCAWCLMLVSRGPVYPAAKAGGSKYDSETTLRVLQGDTEVEKMMNEWHTGCDCLVVPVFDLADWPGLEAQQRAEQLYIDAQDDATAWRERYPDRVHLTGKNKGKPFTFNEDVVLAMRRRIEGGLINSQEWAALTPAA